ncbi:hypothetical protein E2C01_027649 [Portunus trituberculatus]|uniref:Uncharacterized protein n=1 Tax=Portunus trituberculatus TaxID=210409 RepID=A0A5B7EM39_PORTR|nr:hypothetical protein [Portunus trituberculatus]
MNMEMHHGVLLSYPLLFSINHFSSMTHFYIPSAY